jgi:hypothetical protein
VAPDRPGRYESDDRPAKEREPALAGRLSQVLLQLALERPLDGLEPGEVVRAELDGVVVGRDGAADADGPLGLHRPGQASSDLDWLDRCAEEADERPLEDPRD